MKREYVSSVTLIILGKKLEPERVTMSLGLTPSQQWKVGDLKFAGGKKLRSKHTYGGWKKLTPKLISNRPIETQIRYWIKELTQKRKRLKSIRMAGNVTYLDLFITTDETATFIWSDELVVGLSSLGIEIKFNFMAGYATR